MYSMKEKRNLRYNKEIKQNACTISFLPGILEKFCAATKLNSWSPQKRLKNHNVSVSSICQEIY